MKSDIVCSALLGTYRKKIKLGTFSFYLKLPTLSEISFMLGNSRNLNKDSMNMLQLSPERSVRVLSKALFKHRILRSVFVWYVMRYSAYEQIAQAMNTLSSVIVGKDLMEAVKFDEVRSNTVIETVGNNSIAGITATLMESLKTSFHETWYDIPYSNLLLMSADKVRTLSSNEVKVTKVSGKDLANRRKRK